MSGDCEMGRGGVKVDRSDPTRQLLMVQFMGDPRDTSAIHEGKLMLSFGLFGEKGVMENEGVKSFELLDGDVNSATLLVVSPAPDRWLGFVLDEKANTALQLFATERLVRVQSKDGSTSLFRFPTKGYASSRAMFDACIQSLRKKA